VSTPSGSFIAVRFDSVDDAEAALPGVRALDVNVRDAAVVIRTDAGRIELQQERELAAGEAFVGGGSVGLVAGLLLGLPVGGALLGLAGGLAYGLRDRGLPDSRMRRLGEDLQPGHALLCVLVDDADRHDAREALSRYGAVCDVRLAPGSDGDSGSDAGSVSAP
jgi:uncharacterized membrane protein